VLTCPADEAASKLLGNQDLEMVVRPGSVACPRGVLRGVDTFTRGLYSFDFLAGEIDC
jgi:hypothetical protein